MSNDPILEEFVRECSPVSLMKVSEDLELLTA